MKRIIAIAIAAARTTAHAGPDPATSSTATAEREPYASLLDPAQVTPQESVVQPAPVNPPPPREPCAADVAGAPRPGEESGRLDPIDGGDGTLRQIGRGILFVPRIAVDVVLAPVRAGVWADAKYDFLSMYKRVFFNEPYTIGLYPTISFESGFGLNVGARFVDRDTFGQHEHLALQAAFGGQFRQLVSGAFRTGDRLGKGLAVELDLGYERRPIDGFYGIGNGDAVDSTAMPIDPRIDDTSVEARYRQQRARATVMGDVRIVEPLHVRSAVSISDVEFGASEQGPPIDMLYNTASLVGFAGVRYAYEELELRWDNRHQITALEPRSLFASGWLASGFAGRFSRVDGGRDFMRYGIDLQNFLRIGAGPRVLATRFHGEAVTGSRDDVPFNELPKLGGLAYLRGYAYDRFRDRVAAFGSAEYQWDLAQRFSASVFVDAGRVFPSMSDLSLDHLRVGYGIALEVHTEGSFVLQGSIASSIDGGVFFNLSFNPVFDIEERVRRR